MEYVTVGYEKKYINTGGLQESTYNYLVFTKLNEMTDKQIKKMVTRWLDKQNENISWYRVYEVHRRPVTDDELFLKDRADFLGHFHLVNREENTMTYYDKNGVAGDISPWEIIIENSI